MRGSRRSAELPTGGGRGRPRAKAETAAGQPTGRQRLVRRLWPPRVTRAQLIVALLLFVLGLGLADPGALDQRQQRAARRPAGGPGADPRRAGRPYAASRGREAAAGGPAHASWRTAPTRPRRPASRPRQKERATRRAGGHGGRAGPGHHDDDQRHRGRRSRRTCCWTRSRNCARPGPRRSRSNGVRVVADTYFTDCRRRSRGRRAQDRPQPYVSRSSASRRIWSRR